MRDHAYVLMRGEKFIDSKPSDSPVVNIIESLGIAEGRAWSSRKAIDWRGSKAADRALEDVAVLLPFDQPAAP